MSAASQAPATATPPVPPQRPASIEQELQRARDEIRRLRDELDASQRALDQARRDCEAADQAKDRFLSSVSHELRTPLSAIVLWTSLIEDQKIVEPQQLREALDSIRRSAEEQRALIEDLVDSSRIASGKVRLERRDFDLAAVVHNGIEDTRPLAREKHVEIEEILSSDTGHYHGDAHRMQQLVGQLVNNAVKFTPAGGRIKVDVHRDAAEMTLSVADTGIGLAPEHLHRIFERFMQVEHARVRTEKGMGLGLAISRQIAELHGGSIRAESPGVGQGSTFIVRLPLHPPGSPAALPHSPGEKPQLHGLLAQRRVLLVEDDPGTRRALRAVLAEAGAQVDEADSAPAALEAYEHARPGVIVSDLGLPLVDGFSLLRQIRELEQSGHSPPVPAVAVSAFAGDDICTQALEAGFQTCLAKPIEPLQLVSTLVALTAP